MEKKQSVRFGFTMQRIEELTCPPSGRPEKDGRLWFYDTQVPGLAMMVTESWKDEHGVQRGGAKTFYLYRRIGGIPKRIRLGTIEEINVTQARRRVGELNSQVATGRNPAKEKQADREKAAREATVGQLWTSYGEHWLNDRKPRTIEEFSRLYKNFLSKWERRGIASIERGDVEKLKLEIGKNSHVNANRTMALLSAMYRRRGHVFGLPRSFTPTAGVDFYREKPRSRVLSVEEFGKVMSAIADENEVARDYFRMLIYCGQRKNTVARMSWQDLNIDGGTWKIPGEKTKNGNPLALSLIPEAVEILQRRYKTNPEDSPFVFPSQNITPATVERIKALRAEGKTTREVGATVGLSQTAVMHVLSARFVQRGITAFGGASKAWRRIMGVAGIPHATIHDLRRSFCTSMLERGIPLPLVSAAMGHRSMATTQRHYAFASDKAVANATKSGMAGLLSDVAAAQKAQRKQAG